MRRRLTQWLFITLLLLGQAVLAAHGVEFDSHANGEDACSVCLLAASLDHSAGAEFVFSLPLVDCRLLVLSSYIRPAQASYAAYLSRAPPVTHSSLT